MAPPPRRASSKQSSSSSRDLRHRILTCLTRLSERDTHSLAASELESIIPTLTPDTFSLFITSLSSTSSSADRSSVRSASLRLLSSLAASHRSSLSPHLPKLTSALLRRLRDHDSSVRSACAAAAASLSSNVATTPSSLSAILRSLAEALSTEQEPSAQSAAAMCLSAAVDAASPDADPAALVGKMLPKWIRLLKCDGFKAKASILALIRSVIRLGGIGNSCSGSHLLLTDLVRSLADFVKSDEWTARKAAAEALSELAVVERSSLSEFKASCLKIFESRRFDKVKAVREAMNVMLDAWKDVPDVLDDESPPPRSQASSRENESDERYPPRSSSQSRVPSLVDSNTPQSNKNTGSIPSRRSSGNDSSTALKTTARSRPALGNSRRTLGPTSFRKLEFNKKPSDCTPAVVSCRRSSLVAPVWEEIPQVRGEELGRTTMSVQDQKRNINASGLNDNELLPVEDDDGYQKTTAFVAGTNDDDSDHHKDCEDLSSIQKQLVQIEIQQSSLMDVLQKFIGSSQDGMQSLESRVNGLELALDDMSYDLAVNTTRMAKSETPTNSCCLLPSSDFLSPKFWRRSETRSCSTTRFSLPSNDNRTSTVTAVSNNMTAVQNPYSSTVFDNKSRFTRGPTGATGFIINPLAEVHVSDSKGIS